MYFCHEILTLAQNYYDYDALNSSFVRMRVSVFLPEGTKAHAPNHVEKAVKYDQAQQQIEKHGLCEGERAHLHFLVVHAFMLYGYTGYFHYFIFF